MQDDAIKTAKKGTKKQNFCPFLKTTDIHTKIKYKYANQLTFKMRGLLLQ